MNQPVSHPELLFWRRLALLLVLVAAAALTIELWPVIAPFLAAFLLAYLLNPVIGQMTRMGLSRQVAILLVLLGGLVVLVVGFVLLLPPLVQQVLYVQDNWPAMVSWVNSTLIPWLEAHLGLEVPLLNGVELKNYLMNFASEKSSAEQAGSALAWVARSGLSLANFLGLVVLVPIITLYLLWDFNALGRRFKNLVPLRYRAKVLDLFVECHAALGAFVRGQLAVMTALGLIYALGLELVGLDLGLLVGLISGLASIVPYVGFAVGLTISITMGLVQNGLDMSFLLSIFCHKPGESVIQKHHFVLRGTLGNVLSFYIAMTNMQEVQLLKGYF